MKKTILILVVLALMIPTAALAQTEFSLGGFIKMDTMWDSSVVNKNLVGPAYRDNDPVNQHGRFRAMATGSRFNFTVKGPKLWGAQVTGFIEADWDAQGASTTAAGQTDSQDTGTFRLRHAMFRLNWPETELLMGQYWSFFSEYFPESANDGAFHYRGANVYRPAQIRVTQKFLGAWTVAAMLATPRTGTSRETASTDADEKSETPHLEAKIAFEQDLWGKAAYYGKPRGFAASVAGAWQRTNVYGLGAVARPTWGSGANEGSAYGAQALLNTQHQLLNHWAIQGSLFIPIIPTTSANLAGTASIMTQWAVGQGQGFVLGTWLTQDAFLSYDHTNTAGAQVFTRVLTPSLTGFVQGQYYFTNDWFLNVCWGFMKNYGLGMDRITAGGNFTTAFVDAAVGTGTTGNSDFTKYSHQIIGTLWYRPIQALKFGLQYSYTQDHYFQPIRQPAAAGSWTTDIGEDHRVEFVGFFFF